MADSRLTQKETGQGATSGMAPGATPKIAVIGLGAMGMGTAKALLDAGLSVTGCDINADALTEFQAAGGNTATTPAEAAKDASIVLLIVVNADQVETVLFGQNGVLTGVSASADASVNSGTAASVSPNATPGTAATHGLGPNPVILQNATVPPAYAEVLATRMPEGVEILDAPISGGAVKARDGELSVMASGSDEAFRRAAPALDAMAATVHNLGDHCGPGSSVKLVNQLLAGVHIATAAEAMALGLRMGLDAQTIYKVITASAGNSWMFENRMAHVLEGDYAPRSAVEIFVKDLGIVTQTGRDLRFPLPLSAAAQQQFTAAAAAGYSRQDDSAVIKVYERLAGIKLPAAANDGAAQ